MSKGSVAITRIQSVKVFAQSHEALMRRNSQFENKKQVVSKKEKIIYYMIQLLYNSNNI